jgi:predicted HicB family RNase H-like nuclease
MTDVLEYKNFIGSVRYSAVDNICYGKLEGIEDLIVFKGDSVEELNSAFKRAVEEYEDQLKKFGNRDTSPALKALLS